MIEGSGGRKNLRSLHRMDSERKFAGNFGASSGKRRTSKIERGNLKTGAVPSRECPDQTQMRSHPKQIYNVFEYTLFKKNTTPRLPTPSRASLEITRSNYSDRPRDASTMDKNMHKCMALDEPLIGL